jgi:tetratricopeptide (TPR) repeat protein
MPSRTLLLILGGSVLALLLLGGAVTILSRRANQTARTQNASDLSAIDVANSLGIGIPPVLDDAAGAGRDGGVTAPQGRGGSIASTESPDHQQDIEPSGLTVSDQPLAPVMAAYLEGLEKLEAAQWAAAAEALGQAIEAGEDTPDYFQARGVAWTLAERFAEALADLGRAAKLDPASKETRMWRAVALEMSGDGYRARETYQSHTNDSYETFVGQMRVDYGLFIFHRQRGEATAKEEALLASARSKFPQAASWFSSRMKDTPRVAQALFHRAKQRFQRGEYAAALNDLFYVRRRFPKDMAVLYYRAACLTPTGDAATAQREHTQVLTQFTNFGLGYLGRAQASVRLGDARRARADLAVAGMLRPQDAAAFQAQFDRGLAALQADAPTEAPAVLRAALLNLAETDAPREKLVEQAAALHKAVLVRRLNEDEVYQTRLKSLEDAVRTDPRSPHRLVELAEFLTRAARERYERHATRGPFRILRQEVPRDPEGEFARAARLADAALAINPKHAAALVAKARVRFEFHQFGDADKLLQQALAIQEDVPDGLELFARVVTIGANQAEAAARRLETPQSGSTPGYYSTIYWTRYPTVAELREAEEFRKLARQRLERAREIFEKAIKLRPNNGEGFYDLALWRLQQNDLPEARKLLEKAVQLAPRLVRARQALAKVYRDLGLKEQAFEEESILIVQIESGISDLLTQAAKQMERTAWKTADALLTKGTEVDPVDARVAAYQGIIRLAEKNAAAASAIFQVGAALEEARLRTMGITTGMGAIGTRAPDDLALLMVLRLRLAGMCLQGGRAEQAQELAENNLSLERLIAVGDLLQELPRSVLPDVDPDPTNRHPEPEHAASLLAWSHYLAGEAARRLRRIDAAVRHFQSAFSAGRSLTVGVGTRALNEPRNRAGLALAATLAERGDHAAAREVLQRVDVTVRHSHSKELAAERNRLQQALMQGRGPR